MLDDTDTRQSATTRSSYLTLHEQDIKAVFDFQRLLLVIMCLQKKER